MTLPGTEDHPQARIVLSSALSSGPSHAYLFHGPAGTGKRTVARAFAAELLAEGADDPDGVRLRVSHETHPDLTWVKPSGAHVMRKGDVAESVVIAATRTPFEAKRRVFVLEQADTLNDEAANSLLKTLEEPASFVHLILLTDAPGRMVETVVSRCQAVRFEPLPAERIASRLVADGVSEERALACARLSLGNASRAHELASEDGAVLRDDVERFVFATLGALPEPPLEPWRPLFDRACARRAATEEEVAAEAARRLELEPKGRERRALEREFEEAAKRDGRRAMRESLELSLILAVLTFRDLVCLVQDAADAVMAVDRIERLSAAAAGRDPAALRAAAERCEDVRQSLELNVSEDLALAALGFRLTELAGAPA